jgi:hypothetical protein
MVMEFTVFYWRQKLALDALREVDAQNQETGIPEESIVEPLPVPFVQRIAGMFQRVFKQVFIREKRNLQMSIESPRLELRDDQRGLKHFGTRVYLSATVPDILPSGVTASPKRCSQPCERWFEKVHLCQMSLRRTVLARNDEEDIPQLHVS